MTYQGFLVDANNTPLAPVTPENYPVKFRIYDEETGGAVTWAEQQIVTVDKGSFSVVLGEGNAIGGPRPNLSEVFAGGANRYLELTVTIDEEDRTLLPRLRLLPAPYAFMATSATQLVDPSGTAKLSVNNGKIVGDGSGLTGLTANQITSGTLNPAQIPNLDAAKITSGTLNPAQIPNLDAAKITSGTLNNNQIPTDLGSKRFSGSVYVDYSGTNDGTVYNPDPAKTAALRFGNEISGEGIASKRTTGGNQYGLDFYTGYQSRLSVGSNGNIGIGTSSPSAKLQVMGEVKLGSNGDQFAVSGEESLRIVRGTVSASGTIRAGSGFTVGGPLGTPPGTFGSYVITVAQPFSSDQVTIVATLDSPNTRGEIYATHNSGNNEFLIVTKAPGGSDAQAPFNFIIMGPR
jgi:hypothetical protein